ncbi:MAG TPA: DUF3006 domain-containing protein [Gemmatimonadaceae bacterium]
MSSAREHRWAVDGIEDGVARIEEDGARIRSIPVYLLPPGTKEGQLLRVVIDSAKGEAIVATISIDVAGTATALEQSKAVTDRALRDSRKRDPGGNITL